MREMDWNLRPASLADADRLALIGAATFLETFASVLDGAAIVAHCRAQHAADAYVRYFGQGASAWLAEAEPGHAPLGFALVGEPDIPGSRDDGSDIELKRIYALSRFHGAGMGAALMAEAIGHGRARGRKRLLLGVYRGNARARAFYGRQGFVEIGERQFNVGGTLYDDVVLARDLQTPLP